MSSLPRAAGLDPRTPVLAGVGQTSERLDEPGYQRRSAVQLAADAARTALADTFADVGAVASAIDTVAGVRQFENPFPARGRRWAGRTTFPGRWPGVSAPIRPGPSWR